MPFFPYFFVNLLGVLKKALQYGLFVKVIDVHKQANNRVVDVVPKKWAYRPLSAHGLLRHKPVLSLTSKSPDLGSGRWKGDGGGYQRSNT